MCHHSHAQIGAGNGTRTRDPELGRLALYQLSYSRARFGGEGRIRTFEGIAGRFTVCSLWPLGNLSSLFPCTKKKKKDIKSALASPTTCKSRNYVWSWR